MVLERRREEVIFIALSFLAIQQNLPLGMGIGEQSTLCFLFDCIHAVRLGMNGEDTPVHCNIEQKLDGSESVLEADEHAVGILQLEDEKCLILGRVAADA